MTNKKIMIIDDDQTILSSLERSIGENFELLTYSSPKEALGDIQANISINLIILDIWMPEIDGIQLAKEIRRINQDIPILCISGHANLDSNFRIAKIGVNDFLEKPFTQANLIYKIKKLLGEELIFSNSDFDYSPIEHLFKTSTNTQKTLNKEIVITGRGIHRGENTGIILSPSEEGLFFEDIVSGTRIYPNIDSISASGFNTTLSKVNSTISVTEHLLSALFMYGVDNLIIKVNKEIPILDGSAIEFCEAIEKVGVRKLSSFKKEVIIDQTYTYVDPEDPSKYLSIEPFDGFCVDYTFDLPGFGDQSFFIDFTPNPAEIFKKEIAPSRTFGFIEELKYLQDKGFGQGGGLNNFLLLDNNKVINQKLRFENEFTRHKILDLCGDFSLLGYCIRGKVVAHKTGHRHNTALLKEIIETNK